jgi:hypothetical protein
MVAVRVLENGLARVVALLRRGGRADVPAALEHAQALRRAIRWRPARADAAQLPLALPLTPEAPVQDCPLGCPVTALVCVARQIQSDQELNARDPSRPRELARHDGKRGRTPSRPTCVTARCAVGREVRAALGDLPEAKAMAARAPRASDTSES